MWDAVRKIFSRDDTETETPAEGGAAPHPAPRDTTQPATGPGASGPGLTREASPAAGLDAADGTGAPVEPVVPTEPSVSARGAVNQPHAAPLTGEPRSEAADVEVSPPGHAPQGLAADATAPDEEALAELSTPDLPPITTPPVDAERSEIDRTAPLTPQTALEMPAAAPETPPSIDLDATTAHAAAMAADAATHAEEVTSAAMAHAEEITAEAADHAAAITAPAAGTAPAVNDTLEPLRERDGAPPAKPPAGEASGAAGDAASAEAPSKAESSATPPSEPAPPTLDGAEMEPALAAQQATAADVAEGGIAETPPGVADDQAAATEGAMPEEQEAETEAAPVTGEETQPVPTLTPLAPGTVVGDRYTITALAEDAEPSGDVVATYQATDSRSYEQCWSCGSAGNGPGTRFCQNCGAPIQNHPLTLVQTRAATGLPTDVEQDGAFFHVQPERRRFGAEGIGVEIGAHSAEGPHHPNEDSYWYTAQALCANSKRQSSAVVVFADGMGGYAPGSGLISARIAATTGMHIVTALAARAEDAGPLESGDAESIVRAGIAAANKVVLEEVARTGEMGATLVVAVIHGDMCYVANVGDSRAYYVDPRGTVEQITRDQSLVAQEIAQGHLDESDIYTAIGNNIILHAIGEEDVQQVADWYTQPLEPGSYLILCSDGYWKTMRGVVLPEGLFRDNATLSDAARTMVDDALAHDSDDNTTIVLAGIS